MPDPIPLEDNFTDLIGKAMRGLVLADSEVAARAGVSTPAVTELRRSAYDAATLAAEREIAIIEDSGLSFGGIPSRSVPRPTPP